MPTDESRTLVLGKTGTGKTQFSFYLLARQNYTEVPWIVIDYKKDRLFTMMLKAKLARILKVGDKPPKHPGVYIYRPILRADDNVVEAFLMEVYRKGDIGIYFDEGYAVPQGVALDALLTQGRSLKIPIIILYQRPVWLTKFGKSQADYVATFHLKTKQDRLAVLDFTGEIDLPDGKVINANTRLPKYHCLWYDDTEDRTTILRPVPDKNVILQMFRSKMGRNQQRRFA